MDGSGAFFRQIVESSPDGIWAIDQEGRTVFANLRAAELLCRSQDEMQRLTVFDVLDEQGRGQFAEHLRRVRSQGPNEKEVTCDYLCPDGSHARLVVSEGALRNDAGRLVGLVHRMTDDLDRRELITELSRKQEKLDEAQSIGRMGSYELDLHTGWVEWSDQMYLLFGADPSEFAPSVEGFLDRVVEEDRPKAYHTVERSSTDGGEYEYDLRMHRPDGSVAWYRARSRTTNDAAGRPQKLVGTLQDITDIKDAEAQLLDAVKLNALLQTIVTDANSSATINEALTRIRQHLLDGTDWSRAVALETGPDGLVPFLADDPRSEPAPSELALAREVQRTRDILIEDDPHHPSPLVGFLLGLPGAEDVIVVLTGRGPIRRSWMVRAMVSQISSQVTRVAERERDARRLAAARDAAMEASQLKSDFLATMSHEIRTPMNGVIGLNELLLQSPLDAAQHKLALGVRAASRSLLELINDILDFSKIEAGELELDSVRFDVRAVVAESVDPLSAGFEHKRLPISIDVAHDVPTELVGDPVRFRQILGNLLSNAVKFTKEGNVEVRVRLDERLEERIDTRVMLHVEVCDTGIGIPEGQRERLFEPFRQADASTTRIFGGTGLGLAIARRLVQALQGDIGVQSTPGRGSRFWFTAAFDVAAGEPAVGAAGEAAGPAAGEAAGPAAGEAAGPSRSEPRAAADPGATPCRGRVLVVEDNEINQMVATGLLEALGYTAEIAGDGAEAVRMAARDEYDAVLMDLQMPVQDGFTASREIRAAEPAGRRVPIIAMTASAMTGERERCLAAGMDDFLSKPVSSEQLAATLREHLANAARSSGPDRRPGREPDRVPEKVPEDVPGGRTILDTRRLDELLAMGPAAVPIVERAVTNLMAAMPQALQTMEQAVRTHDPDALRDVAHKLKGSALNLGATTVADITFELEQYGDAGSVDATRPSLERLRRAVEATTVALSAYQREHGGSERAQSR